MKIDLSIEEIKGKLPKRSFTPAQINIEVDKLFCEETPHLKSYLKQLLAYLAQHCHQLGLQPMFVNITCSLLLQIKACEYEAEKFLCLLMAYDAFNATLEDLQPNQKTRSQAIAS